MRVVSLALLAVCAAALLACSGKKYGSLSECLLEESKTSADKNAISFYCRSNYAPNTTEKRVIGPEAVKMPTEEASEPSSATLSNDASQVIDKNFPNPAQFAGKYPWDRVSGYGFLSLPVVRNAIQKSSPNNLVFKNIVNENVTTGGIGFKAGIISYNGCEPHNCGDHNWKILFRQSDGIAEVCYFDADSDGSNNAWYPMRRPLAEGETCLD